MPRTEDELRQTAADVAAAVTDEQRAAVEEHVTGEIKLSTGIKLALRDVPPLALRQANLVVPVPEVPVAYIEDKGREEANPNHPEYVTAVEERDIVVYQAAVDVALIMGTTCAYVPDGYVGPDDDRWVEELAAGGIDVDVSTEPKRYLNWLHLYALRNADDLRRTTYNALVRAGLQEAEVAAAIVSFLGAARGGAHHRGDAERDDSDGDPIPADDPGPGP